MFDILGKWDIKVFVENDSVLLFAFTLHSIMLLIGYIQFRDLLNSFKKSNNQIHSDLKITVDAINSVEVYRSCKFSNYDDKYFCFSYKFMEVINDKYDNINAAESKRFIIKNNKIYSKDTSMLKMGTFTFLRMLIIDIFVILMDSKKKSKSKVESDGHMFEIMISTDKVVKIEVE